MAALVPFIFNTPGIAGLNKQGRTSVLGQEWATVATNLVIDSEGRLAHRNGTKAINVSTHDVSGTTIETQFVGVNNNGTATRYAADDTGDLFELNGSMQWVDVTGATAATDGNWKFQNFNGKVLGWHADGEETVQSAVGANFAAIVASSGSVPAGVDVLASSGRVWVIGGQTLSYSGLLDETDWASGGGSFNLQHAWPAGQDVAVAIAEFNGFIVVFGERSLIVYQNPDDVANFAKVEAVEGAGCVNRDTVKNVGKDILFLSRDGLKSLGRVIQEKSMPLSDVAPQVKDYIRTEYASSTATDVTAAFSESNSFYVLSLQQTTIVVDTRLQMPNGAYRVTEWDAFSAVAEDSDGGLLLADGDRAYKYQGIKDLVDSTGAGGNTLAADFESGWLDFGEQASALTKYLKRFRTNVVGGGSATLTFKWYFDYSEVASTAARQVPAASTVAQYGIAQYAIAKYGTDVDVSGLRGPGKKGGRVIKFGFSTANSTTALSINSIDLYAKVGKLAV